MARTRKSKIRVLKGPDLQPGDAVWVYMRHSSGEDQTIFSQRKDVEKYVADNQLVVAQWFVDEAKTAAEVAGRRDFERMLAASREQPPPPSRPSSSGISAVSAATTSRPSSTPRISA